jgi:hypothetical protein
VTPRRPVESDAASPSRFLPNTEAVEALASALAPLVAERLHELLGREVPTGSARPLTAREVADRLGRSYDFVREHRHELGVLAAEGARPRLLFDPQQVEAWATSCSGAVRSPGPDPSMATAKAPRRRPARSGTGWQLLPIHGVNEVSDAA